MVEAYWAWSSLLILPMLGKMAFKWLFKESFFLFAFSRLRESIMSMLASKVDFIFCLRSPCTTWPSFSSWQMESLHHPIVWSWLSYHFPEVWSWCHSVLVLDVNFDLSLSIVLMEPFPYVSRVALLVWLRWSFISTYIPSILLFLLAVLEVVGVCHGS